MLKKYLKYIIAFAVVVALLITAAVCTTVWGESTKTLGCSDCGEKGYVRCEDCTMGLADCGDCEPCEKCTSTGKIDGQNCEFCNGKSVCATCNSTGVVECTECNKALLVVCSTCEGATVVTADSNLYSTFWSLIPPIIAIFLALITKETFSSLFIGILAGALFYANFNPIGTWDNVTNGFISAVADPWNSGIFIFLILLGVMVALINSSGGAAAFGRWATANIKTRVGALMATFVLGVLIFVDDYFNCLTVGSVMKPITDKHKVSRAKLSYLIDATAAPICMIAPVSSWAAAVSSVAAKSGGEYSGIELFIRAIPYNFYSLLTIIFVIAITILGLDYGPMKMRELAAIANGNLGPMGSPEDKGEEKTKKGIVLDLLFPIIVLIVFCILGMIYVGGFFDSFDIIGAFSATDASVGLPWGALIALIITIVYLIARKAISFKQAMECIPKGFIAMVPAILILTFALTLKNVTNGLGADSFVDGVLANAEGLQSFLPAIIFLIACFIAFSTGTSWGTFGILIPIITAVFPVTSELYVIGISACLAGAVCGDHCSPISDTTIMASAGANSDHITHISTQLPYAITVAAVSFVAYIIAGFVKNVLICLPIAIVLMLGTVIVINEITKKKAKKEEA